MPDPDTVSGTARKDKGTADEMTASNDHIALGIDLGATGLKAAYLDNQGSPRVLSDIAATGGRSRDGALRSGHHVRCDPHRWKYHVGGSGLGSSFSEAEATAILARRLEETCRRVSTLLGKPVSEATIAIPPCFTARARQVVCQAAERANLVISAIPPEPIAAAFLCLREDPRDDLTIMTYDFGRAFNVAVVAKCAAEPFPYMLKSIDGNLNAASDIDCSFVDWLVYRLNAEGYELHLDDLEKAENRGNLASLIDCVETAKVALSSHSCYRLRGRIHVGREPTTFDLEITRKEFSELIDIKVKDTILLCRRAIARSADCPTDRNGAWDIPLSIRRLKGELDEIIMLGGLSRVPLVQTRLAEEFGHPLGHTSYPEHCVAMGAAALAGAIRTVGYSAKQLLPDICCSLN